MMSVFMGLMLACGSTLAASRVVITTPEPMQVFVDGLIIPTSVGTVRTSIPHITPGAHDFAFHSLTGSPLHAERLEIPDNADVRITFIPGAPLTVTGGASTVPSSATQIVANQTSNAAGMEQSAAAGPNQAQSASRRQPTTGSVMDGSAVSTGSASGLQRAMTASNPTTLVAGAAKGLKTFGSGTHTGANFGKAPPAKQTIKKANVVYGETLFRKSGGGPLVIYENGHMLVQLGAGPTEVRVPLEVGRRELEIRSGLDYRILFQGDLQVDQTHIETLNISDTSPPTATVRPWLWKDL